MAYVAGLGVDKEALKRAIAERDRLAAAGPGATAPSDSLVPGVSNTMLYAGGALALVGLYFATKKKA